LQHYSFDLSVRSKNIIYSLLLVTAVFVVWKYRQGNTSKPVLLEGKTMGTTYHITYFDDRQRNFKPQIDSLLMIFNQSLSTYLSDSEVSQFNRGWGYRLELPFFQVVLLKSKEVVDGSVGAFDPTVMPLVNAWGFGPGKNLEPDSLEIDSIREFVGFDLIHFNEDSVWKSDVRTQLDFSAIAKGYGVDMVAGLLQQKGLSNYFVEIGGEVVAKGKNIYLDKPWQVGILDPGSNYEQQYFIAYATLEDKAIATSGNYFNFREVNGVKYSHTINPHTGYPIRHEILSATVVAEDCMTADAWATAFMVMGHEKAIDVVKAHPELGAFFVYSSSDKLGTFMSDGIKSSIQLKRN
jgi:thiamine biosynthesis lipoprotein